MDQSDKYTKQLLTDAINEEPSAWFTESVMQQIVPDKQAEQPAISTKSIVVFSALFIGLFVWAIFLTLGTDTVQHSLEIFQYLSLSQYLPAFDWSFSYSPIILIIIVSLWVLALFDWVIGQFG